MNTFVAIPIPADQICAGGNDRQTFDADALAELAASIKQNGLAQPPTVRPMKDGRYEIVAGERRVRAMRDVLAWPEIPVILREMDDETASAIMLSENTARADLNPVEEARAYRKRLDAGWRMARLCEVSGRRQRVVEQHLALLALPEDIQHYVNTRALPMSYAMLLDTLDTNRQRIAVRIYNQTPGMTLIRWRDVVARLRDEQARDQPTLFGAADLFTVQELSAASKGRQAVTGVPRNISVPPVRRAPKENMATIFERHLLDLKSEGHLEAAAAVGNLYNTFVGLGFITVTSNLALPTRNPHVGTVGENLHETLI
jgi:ParB/RepB/Spo0J family partition protein